MPCTMYLSIVLMRTPVVGHINQLERKMQRNILIVCIDQSCLFRKLNKCFKTLKHLIKYVNIYINKKDMSSL